ncbi:MAG: ankyrin repeat domain-containing protein [Pseudomonadota bacterium]
MMPNNATKRKSILFTLSMLILLLSVGFSHGYTDLDMKLFRAAQDGDVEKIAALLEQGADINVRAGSDKWTPLMTASREGHPEAVTFLLQEGAEVNLSDSRFNKNAYHWALQYGHRDIARLLLENGSTRELKKPSRFVGRGMFVTVFSVLVLLLVSANALYLFAVAPYLRSNGIFPASLFMGWRFRDELEGYAQLRQAQSKSLTIYHIIKYLYYAIYILMVIFIITLFRTCQGDQQKSQYEILKGSHDAHLDRMLDK